MGHEQGHLRQGRIDLEVAPTNTTQPIGVEPDYYLVSLTRPDGEILTYNYSAIPVAGSIIDKLRSIVSSGGFEMRFEWTSSGLSKVRLINRNIAYCDPVAASCNGGSSSWPTISWSLDSSMNVTATTSATRNVFYAARQRGATVIGSGTNTVYEWNRAVTSGAGVVTTYTTRNTVPSEPGPPYYGFYTSFGECIDASKIWRVQSAAGTWSYDYGACSPSSLNAVRTNPDGTQEKRVGSTFVDELIRQTAYTYNMAYNPAAPSTSENRSVDSITYPEGNKATFGYSRNNLTSTTMTPKAGSGSPTVTWTSSYPASCPATAPALSCNKPDFELDPKGNRTDYTYDPVHGGVATKTLPPDPNGVRAQVRYVYQQYSAKALNSSGTPFSLPPIWKLQSTSACRTQASCAGTADEVVTSYTYNDSLLVASETVRAGDNSAISTTTRTYDAIGNLVSVDGPVAGADDTTRYVYDPLRRPVAVLGPDPDGGGPLPVPATRTTYDGDGQVTLVETGSAADRSDQALAAMTVDLKVVVTYDSAGRKASESLVGGGTVQSVTQYSYDNRGRLECTAVRMNAAAFASLPASACALGAQGSFGPDRITRNVYDSASQLLTVQRAYGVTTANFFPATLQQNYAGYEYTGNGKRKAVIDANGNRAELRYDGLDRQSCWIFPSKTAGGALGGDCSTGDFESYGYDLNGNRTSLRKRDGVTLGFQYDGLNRVTSKNVPASVSGAPGYSVYYGYDLRGLQAYARFGSAAGSGVTNAYDAFGRLASSTTDMDGTARTFNSQYDAAGNRTALGSPSNYYAAFSYDVLGRMTSYDEGGTPMVRFAYDSNGRRSSLANGPGSTSTLAYGYDPAGRLNGLTRQLAGTAADQAIGFAHNPASQIVTRTSSNDAYASSTAYNVSRAYSVNGLNQYTAAGPASFLYDSNGNLISDGSSSYVYDSENRLVSVSGAKTASLAYDPLGRLWQTSGGSSGTTRFVYDGDRLVEEYDGAGNRPRVYVHGSGADEPLMLYELAGGPVHRYYHSDHQGSIVAIADDDGNALAINGYDPWGIPNAGNQGRFGYTGQAWIAELGMYYYKARIYSPTLGRFMQTDPVGYEDQVNLYAYVGNDPLNKLDPTGKFECITFSDRSQTCSYDPRNPADVLGVFLHKFLYERGWLASEEIASDRPSGPDGKRGSTGGPGAGKDFPRESAGTRESKDGVPCVYCDESTTNEYGHPNSRERDHIDPKVRGGNNTPENERDSCRTCNRSKGSKDVDEWQELRRKRDEEIERLRRPSWELK